MQYNYLEDFTDFTLYNDNSISCAVQHGVRHPRGVFLLILSFKDLAEFLPPPLNLSTAGNFFPLLDNLFPADDPTATEESGDVFSLLTDTELPDNLCESEDDNAISERWWCPLSAMTSPLNRLVHLLEKSASWTSLGVSVEDPCLDCSFEEEDEDEDDGYDDDDDDDDG